MGAREMRGCLSRWLRFWRARPSDLTDSRFCVPALARGKARAGRTVTRLSLERLLHETCSGEKSKRPSFCVGKARKGAGKRGGGEQVR